MTNADRRMRACHQNRRPSAARVAAELRRHKASERLRAANNELIAAEAEYGAASRDLESFASDRGVE